MSSRGQLQRRSDKLASGPTMFLRAAIAAKAPVSVFFQDGEAIPFARILEVDATTLVLDVDGLGHVVATRASVKKIVSASAGGDVEVSIQE